MEIKGHFLVKPGPRMADENADHEGAATRHRQEKKTSTMILRLLVFFLLCCAFALANTEQICNGNDCYPRIFVPTEDFQVVKEGQEIPKGLHVKINMQTGEKEAKLYNPADDTSNSENLLLNSDLIQVVDSSGQTRKPAMQSYTIPPRVFQEGSSQSDQDFFGTALQELLTDLPNADEISNLESLAHDREYGVKLVQLDPLSRLLQIAELVEESNIRQSAVRIIGSSLWNNPEAMKAVEGTDLIRRLLELLTTEKDAGVRSSLIFSLSAAASGEYGIKEFMLSQGSLELRKIFTGGEPEEQRKCATFVEDNLPSNRAIDGVDQELMSWCKLFQEYLKKHAGDTTSEKVLSTLIEIKKEAREICATEQGFVEWLADNVMSEHSETMLELLKEARHMFGNPKAARKTAWEDEPHPKRDEL